jgi:hypothetical protein
MPGFAVLLTFREVFQKEPRLTDLHSILQKYQRREIVALICKLNCLLGNWKNEPDFDLDRKLARYMLPNHRQRVDAIVGSSSENRLLFSRLTLLYVLKQACIACPNDGLTPLTEEGRSDVGVCCLMANDLALPVLPATSDGTLRRFTSLIPFCDYMSLDHYPMEIARTDLIFEKILALPAVTGRTDFMDVQQLFQRSFEMPVQTFCELVFACATRFLDTSPERLANSASALVLRRDYFRNSKVPPEDVNRFFRKLAIPEAELARRIQESKDRPGDDLTLLQQYPLVEIVPEAFLCVDPGFLIEKAGRGLYWALLSELSGKEKSKLLGFWGEVFEAYVNTILRDSYAAGGIIIPEPHFANGDPSFDACILEGRDLIVMEHKSSVIRADAKYSGDAGKLESELKLKFVEGEPGEAKGVAQLVRNLERFLGGEKLGDLSSQGVSRIFPVLVCAESCMTVPYAGRYLREQFHSAYPRKKFRQVVTPLFTLGIADVENLLGYLHFFRLSAILESFYSSNKSMLSSISLSGVPLLRNVESGANLVKDRFSDFAHRMEQDLFGGTAEFKN